MASGYSDWFEPLYAEAQGDASQVPWALSGAVPSLTNWLAQSRQVIAGRNGLAVVKKETFAKKESRFSDRVQIQYRAPD